MEQIAKMFGGAFMVGICFVAMLMLVYGTAEKEGLLKIGGTLIKSEWEEDSRDGFVAYQEQSKQELPEVTYAKEGALVVGTYTLLDLLTVSDSGETAELKLLSVTEPDGNMREDLEGASEITFSSGGVYQLSVQLKDEGNRTVVKRIQIPVNETGGHA